MNQQTVVKRMVLIDRIFLLEKRTFIRDLIYVLAGSLLIAASAQVSFPIPFSPVPVTGQTFAVLLLAATLGSKRGAAAVLAYIAESLVGLPVLANGTIGLAVFRLASFGYLIGFVMAAYWVGKLAEKGKERSFKSALPTFLQGYVLLFVPGVLWLSYFVGFTASIFQGFVVFIPGEIVKLMLVSAFLPTAWKIVK